MAAHSTDSNASATSRASSRRWKRPVSRVADEPVTRHCRRPHGRRCACHAAGRELCHHSAVRSEDAWRRGISSLTPRAVGVVWARVLGHPFNARPRRAVAPVRLPVQRRCAAARHPSRPCRVVADIGCWPHARGRAVPRRRARLLDLSRRRVPIEVAMASGCTPFKSPRAGEYVTIDLTANAFLLHMVRNIAGALREVGTGNLTPQAFAQLFAQRDRTLAPATAAAAGALSRLGWLSELRANRAPAAAAPCDGREGNSRPRQRQKGRQQSCPPTNQLTTN